MMKIKKIIIFFCLFFLILDIPLSAVENIDEVNHIILIDAGHGGVDGGAKSKSGILEKDINLSISKKLKAKLEENEYKVYMTREDDKQIEQRKVDDLKARCRMKEETKCDAFLSIHQNMFQQSNCFGAQVWYASNDNSKALADKVQDTLKEKINNGNKRVAKAAKNQYRILRDGYEGASILIECGFLSNETEAKNLNDDKYQDQLVEAIVAGVDKYFNKD